MTEFTITGLTRSELGSCLAVLDGADTTAAAVAVELVATVADTAEATTTTKTVATDVMPVDSSGLQYDARIHSGGAVENRLKQDGTWKKKSGVDDETVKTVTAELRSITNPPAVLDKRDPASTAPETPPAPPAAPAVEKVKQMTALANGVSYDDYIVAGWTDEAMIEQGHMILVDAAPPAPPGPPTASTATGDFAEAHKALMDAVNVALENKTLSASDLTPLCAHYGNTNMQDFLTKTPQFIVEVHAHVVAGTLPGAG